MPHARLPAPAGPDCLALRSRLDLLTARAQALRLAGYPPPPDLDREIRALRRALGLARPPYPPAGGGAAGTPPQ